AVSSACMWSGASRAFHIGAATSRADHLCFLFGLGPMDRTRLDPAQNFWRRFGVHAHQAEGLLVEVADELVVHPARFIAVSFLDADEVAVDVWPIITASITPFHQGQRARRSLHCALPLGREVTVGALVHPDRLHIAAARTNRWQLILRLVLRCLVRLA